MSEIRDLTEQWMALRFAIETITATAPFFEDRDPGATRRHKEKLEHMQEKIHARMQEIDKEG